MYLPPACTYLLCFSPACVYSQVSVVSPLCSIELCAVIHSSSVVATISCKEKTPITFLTSTVKPLHWTFHLPASDPFTSVAVNKYHLHYSNLLCESHSVTEDRTFTDIWAPFLIHPHSHSITQDGCLIECYVEEFLQLAHQVAWNDGTLKVVFWSGLDNRLFLQAPAATTPGSLAQYIDHVLLLDGSSFIVGEVE